MRWSCMIEESWSNLLQIPTAEFKFNVGGKHFEVSRALIDGHSDTMLGKLVSDTWNDDATEPVFVDRDGDIFSCVLNYLRYGSIELPITIPRSMFDRELDYYGITSNEGITDQGCLAKVMTSLTAPFKQGGAVCQAKANRDMFFLALECYYQFGKREHASTGTLRPCCVSIQEGHELYERIALNKEEKKLLDEYLDHYFGLVAGGAPNRYGDDFYVEAKK